MKLSDIKPIPALKAALVLAGTTETIYDGDKPTSGLPDDYIELIQNGSFKTKSNQMGIIDGVILVSINIKLLSNGSVNKTKEDIVLGKFEALFENNKFLVTEPYHFRLDGGNLVYGGRGISEGYSTKVLNLLVKMY